MSLTARGARADRSTFIALLIWAVLLGVVYLWWSSTEPEPVRGVPTAPDLPRGYDGLRDVHASAEARRLMEKTLLDSGKDIDQILRFVDISIADGHLVVHFKDLYSELDPARRAGYEEAVAKAWRSTGYVMDRGWSPDVEFVEHTGGSTRSRRDRP